MTMCDTALTEQKKLKEEVISQMYYVLTSFDGIVKDLDDNCEDIYNKVFVPFLKKIRKETAKEILQALRKKAYTNNYCEEIILASEVDELAKQIGVEVE